MILREGRAAAAAFAVLILAGCASGHAATTAANRTAEVRGLRALEHPLLRSIKQTFVAVAANHQSAAGAKLSSAATSASAVLHWLDGHESFMRANRDSLSCLDDPLHELGEFADRLGPLLKADNATKAQRGRLKHTLAEAANCIESSG